MIVIRCIQDRFTLLLLYYYCFSFFLCNTIYVYENANELLLNMRTQINCC